MSPDCRRTLKNSGRFRLRVLQLMLAVAGLLSPALPLSADGPAPALMLAKVYSKGIALQDYWVSEKYDGVRGYWDGEKLLTRGGERVVAPAWFTAGWPKTPLDGELWAGRGHFPKAVSTVRQQTPAINGENNWRAMRFMVFDVPAQTGAFTERIPKVIEATAAIDQPWVQAVVQSRATNHQALQELLTRTVEQGGEGLMLHRGASLYTATRSDDLLKVKTHEDAEARVIGHLPGKGKYSGQLGALMLEMPGVDGKTPLRFKLGTGFNDQQRKEPPPVGSLVTYRYRGVNDSGIPRFASFVRIAG